ncbi:MAG TPA: YbdK family carboxylate-amine ligase [Nakamurella sp.]|nr:YbdK family carboxylate-amine ligase [Nakamurella sp.]
MSVFGSDFTIGVEEELLLVDPDTGALDPSAPVVLDRVDAGRDVVDFELYAAQLELRSGICDGADEALSRLRAARSAVARAGATVLGCGVHPTADFGDAPIVDADRYRAVRALFGGLMSRTPEAALHVHIGLPDEHAAILALNGLREFLPVFIALAANSPWWFGRDSELASARYSLVRPYPTRRIPDVARSYQEYLAASETFRADAGLADPTVVYWDVRLHPRYGTVEVREMDAQSSPVQSAALAALIQATAAALVNGTLTPPATPQDSLGWACFLASRDGLAAPRIGRAAAGAGGTAGAGATVADACRELLTAVRPVSRSLGGADALGEIDRLLRDGNGADRQRHAAQRGGTVALLRRLIEDSNQPAGRSR